MAKLIEYVSPSFFPSRSANSVHVINQCNALAKESDKLILYFAMGKNFFCHEDIYKYYGIKLRKNIILRGVKVNSLFAMQLKIAFYAIIKIIFIKKINRLIISRNLYVSFFMSLFSVSHIYEAHGIESFNLKKKIQNFILRRNDTVAISEMLKLLLITQCSKIKNIQVLHDAASDPNVVDVSEYIEDTDNFKIGYFGHLYSGRGIDIIKSLAKELSDIDFYVVGGDEESIKALRKENDDKNLKIIGFVKNVEARSLMSKVDVLLMPYQKEVSIGIPGSDTSKWMSPLKMFEYMCAKRPIISSNLQVLKEVLTDAENCILVDPKDINKWKESILKLRNDKVMSEKIACKAREDFVMNHTWDVRARSLIDYGS